MNFTYRSLPTIISARIRKVYISILWTSLVHFSYIFTGTFNMSNSEYDFTVILGKRPKVKAVAGWTASRFLNKER